jgi:hypothetical protein
VICRYSRHARRLFTGFFAMNNLLQNASRPSHDNLQQWA